VYRLLMRRFHQGLNHLNLQRYRQSHRLRLLQRLLKYLK
jgi:hypothetical protein